MNHTIYRTLPIAITLSFLPLSHVQAAAFQLVETSGAGAGNAHAGESARANDASTVFHNPAGMSQLSGHQAETTVHIISPSFEFQGSGSFNANNPIIQASGLANAPYQQGASSNNGAVVAAVPNLYYVHDYSKKIKLGLGINVPFGLATEYDNDWVGRYSAIKSEVQTININPSFSYEINDQLAIGAGLNIMHVEATLSNMVDYNLTYNLARARNAALPALPLRPGLLSGDGLAQIEGEDWAMGYNLGVLFTPQKGTRIGLSYRSEIKADLKGDATFGDPSDPMSQQAVQALKLGAGLFQPTDVTAKIDLPSTLALSFYHDINRQWAIMGGMTWTQWDSIQELVIDFENPAQSNNITPLNYENSTFSSLGLNYKYNRQWTLRTGIAFDTSPVTSPEDRTARIPDNDRLWLALGAGYRSNRNLSIDIAYAHLFVDDTDIRSAEAYSEGLPPSGFHALNGTYESAIDILTVQARWQF